MSLLVATLASSAASYSSIASLRQEQTSAGTPSKGKHAVLAKPSADDFPIPPPNSPESTIKAQAFVDAYHAYIDSLGTRLTIFYNKIKAILF